MILGQPLSREGTGRPRDPGAPEPAPAAEPPKARTRQRPALPRARLQARRLRRSRARGVHRGPAPRSREPVRAVEPREAVRGAAPVERGLRDAPEARGARPEPDEQPQHQEILAFLENEIGPRGAEADGSTRKPRGGSTRRSISTRRTRPRYLNLGDVRYRQGRCRRRAIGRGSGWSRRRPERAYLAFARLERAYAKLGAPRPLPRPVPAPDCGQPAGLARPARARAPSDGARQAGRRARPAVRGAREQSRTRSPCTRRSGRRSRRSTCRPRARGSLHRTSPATPIFYVDPHICVRCRYRSTELLWQCPHCHEWNTFVEERIAPAKDDAEV